MVKKVSKKVAFETADYSDVTSMAGMPEFIRGLSRKRRKLFKYLVELQRSKTEGGNVEYDDNGNACPLSFVEDFIDKVVQDMAEAGGAVFTNIPIVTNAELVETNIDEASRTVNKVEKKRKRGAKSSEGGNTHQSARARECSERKKKVGKRLRTLYSQLTGTACKRMPYASLRANNGPVQCLGWPALVKFRSCGSLTGFEYHRLVKALDEGKIKLVFRDEAGETLANAQTSTVGEAETLVGGSTEPTE
ncbi:unnamed protein product [Mucor hiemalis]